MKYIDDVENRKVARQNGVSLSQQAETERQRLLSKARENYRVEQIPTDLKGKSRSRSSSESSSESIRRGSDSKKQRHQSSSKSRSPYSVSNSGISKSRNGGDSYRRSKSYRN